MRDPQPYAVLLHELPNGSSHYDVLLGVPGREALRTIRLPSWPGIADDLEDVTAELLADHRRVYLSYEGELTGGRGRVQRVESGQIVWGEHSAITLRGTLRPDVGGRRLLLVMKDRAHASGQERWTAWISAG